MTSFDEIKLMAFIAGLGSIVWVVVYLMPANKKSPWLPTELALVALISTLSSLIIGSGEDDFPISRIEAFHRECAGFVFLFAIIFGVVCYQHGAAKGGNR
jgi:hypothetical protein